MNSSDAINTEEFKRLVAIDMLTPGVTYKDIAAKHQCSIGKVYAAAKTTRTRKNEAKIQGASEKRKAQASFIEAVLDQTLKSDVLDFLSDVPSASVDLVVTSPPYNVGKQYGDGCDNMAPLKYYGWMCQIISELERVIKPGGVIAMNVGGTRDRNGRIVPLDWVLQNAFKETGLIYQNRTIWPVAHGLTPQGRQAERHESIMIYSKGEPTHFNADPGRTPQKQYDKRAFKGPNRGKASSHPLGAWPTDVWSDVKHVGNNHGEKVDHPAQFSRQLARKIIEMYTICDALVLDPFSGSGTTQIVCAQQGRAFIGADLYYEDVRNEALAGIRAEAARPTPCLTCKAVGPHRHFPGVTAESADFWSEELARERAGLRAPWRAIAKRVDIPVPTLFEMASGE